jgi:hypothetical protein
LTHPLQVGKAHPLPARGGEKCQKTEGLGKNQNISPLKSFKNEKVCWAEAPGQLRAKFNVHRWEFVVNSGLKRVIFQVVFGIMDLITFQGFFKKLL